jgi:methylenetetrahydrofolate--tRNA-(uracil-5-)-methyltransferase
VRYGVMHRNSFINSPGKLDASYQALALPGLYFAGQLTGVEGYVESAASGLVAGMNLAHFMLGKESVDFTRTTAIGALAHYVSEYAGKDFQPMNVNFGIMDALENPPRSKQERYEQISVRSLNVINEIIAKKM